MAPVADPVSVRLDPMHTGFGVAVAATEVGSAFTDTLTDAVLVPQLFVALKIYVPAWAVVVIPTGKGF